MNDDLISQTIQHGSIHAALNKEVVSSPDILFWLSNQETITERYYVAYGAVCNKLHPNEHYLANGQHFLRVKPGYLYIALQYHLDLEIPESIGSEDPLFGFVIEEQIVLYNDKEKSKLLSCAAGFSTKSKTYDAEHYELCFLAHYFPHMKESQQLNEGLVNADWIAKFRYNDKLAMLIINRVRILREHAPLYYDNVIKNEYYDVAKNIYSNKLIYNLNTEELNLFCEFFPDIIPQNIIDMSDNIRKLALLGNDITGYMLGFPIDTMIPDDKRILNALSKMNSMDEEKFVALLQNHTKNGLDSIDSGPYDEYKEFKFANETDVMMESLDSYLLFDIVYYRDGDYIYRFSRAEFDRLLESKKNPWTNSWLPESILISMENKAKLAKKLNLPECVPIADLYKKLRDGTLFTPETLPVKEEESTPENNERLRHYTNVGQFLASFFSTIASND